MRRHVLTIGALLLVSSGVWAADDPRAVVERAIKALGGEELLMTQAASRMVAKGQLKIASGGIMAEASMSCEVMRQIDGKVRTTNVMKLNDNVIEMVELTDGEQAWRKTNGGNWVKLEDKDRVTVANSVHQERVLSLVPLLKDKGFNLTMAESVKVNDRPAVGVKVAFKDKPDAIIYFDQQTGYPCRYGMAIKVPGMDKDLAMTVIMSDYREVDFTRSAQDALKKAGLPIAAEAVLEHLKKHLPNPEKLARGRQLIRQLADEDFDKRETAAAELLKLGWVVVPLLRNAAKDDDVEVRRRAEDCLKKVEEQNRPQGLSAAVQLLGLQQPKDSVNVLLAMLPGADEALACDIRCALHVIGQRKGEPDPSLAKALLDREPLVRKAAEAALGKDGGAYLKQPGRRLFLNGVKQPTKLAYQIGDLGTAELEVIEVQFFNRLADALFSPEAKADQGSQ